jgi:serine protease Do
LKNKLLVSTAAVLGLTCFFSNAEIIPKVMVNGNLISTEAVLIDEHTYVPLRAVFEAAGAAVGWDEETSTAIINTPVGNPDTVVPGIIERASPSVVGIIGKYRPEGAPANYENLAHGSGIIIKSGGDILTNAHVVKDMFMIMVVMNDGKGYEAKVKYIDEESDLALIKVNKIGLPVAKLAESSDIVVGKMVVAIGTPISFSLRNSATVGYISGIDRGIGSPYRLIQTDAAINPGNSGGALVNMNGEVIGVTSSGIKGGGIESTGFAIPIDTVRYVLNHFENYGKVKRASLKAEFKDDWLAEMGLPTENGITIKSIEKNSPLTDAGFKSGNILVSINGEKINSVVELNETMKKYLPGDTVTVGINNGGEIIYKEVPLSDKS